MNKSFYDGLKANLDSEKFNKKNCNDLIDDYIRLSKCSAKKCNNLSGIKDGVYYLFRKYKNALKLKKQNEDVFSQILHDIKSPILSIKFALESVERNEIEEEIYTINAGVLRIIQDFLVLYSFKDGFKSADFDTIFPLEIVQNELKLFAPLLKRKNIKVNVQSMENPNICSHGAIFSRIVSNLISNAIKYAPLSTVIEISIEECTKNLIFRVSNFIAQSDTNDEMSFGMGLFISKRLARRINATLCRKNSPTSVVFELKMPKVDRLNRVR